jgi:hypothetical protein
VILEALFSGPLNENSGATWFGSRAGDSFRFRHMGGKHPIPDSAAPWYILPMNLVLLVIVLLLVFGGGGFYLGGPAIGGGGVGLILLVCLVIFLMGGFRAKN